MAAIGILSAFLAKRGAGDGAHPARTIKAAAAFAVRGAFSASGQTADAGSSNAEKISAARILRIAGLSLVDTRRLVGVTYSAFAVEPWIARG